MLDISDLNVSINGTPILRNAKLNIDGGNTVGLIGRNGAGKTTLMRSIMGLLPSSSGHIQINRQVVTSQPAHARAAMGVGYMPEDRRLISEFTVEENILLPVKALDKKPDPERLNWIYDLLPEISRFSTRKALTLSGGQQKLVALGRALIVGDKLLLLDEPFEGVAPALAKRLIEVIGKLRESGMSVLLSESDNVHSINLMDVLHIIERGEITVRR